MKNAATSNSDTVRTRYPRFGSYRTGHANAIVNTAIAQNTTAGCTGSGRRKGEAIRDGTIHGIRNTQTLHTSVATNTERLRDRARRESDVLLDGTIRHPHPSYSESCSSPPGSRLRANPPRSRECRL